MEKEILHRKYEKIENNIKNHIPKGIKVNDVYVITEKVHGANFSFTIYGNTIDGKNIKYGKRQSYLSIKSKFFDFQTIIESHKNNLLNIFKYVKLLNNDIQIVRIYGELFGGYYPHKDVENNNLKRVQKGVWYSPDIKFYAFDIWTDVKIDNSHYIDYLKFVNICENNNIMYAKPILMGSYKDLINFSVNDFESTIPNLLGLPIIKNNIAEGVVLKSIKSDIKGKRHMIKIKSDKFLEAPKHKSKTHYLIIDNKSCLEEDNKSYLEYINENRLNNLLSKMEEIEEKNMRTKWNIVNMLVDDALIDFSNDNNAYIGSDGVDYIDKKRIIKKCMINSAKDLVELCIGPFI